MARVNGHFLARESRYRGHPLPYLERPPYPRPPRATKEEKRWRVWFYVAVHMAGLEHAPLGEWARKWNEWGVR